MGGWVNLEYLRGIFLFLQNVVEWEGSYDFCLGILNLRELGRVVSNNLFLCLFDTGENVTVYYRGDRLLVYFLYLAELVLSAKMEEILRIYCSPHAEIRQN